MRRVGASWARDAVARIQNFGEAGTRQEVARHYPAATTDTTTQAQGPHRPTDGSSMILFQSWQTGGFIGSAHYIMREGENPLELLAGSPLRLHIVDYPYLMTQLYEIEPSLLTSNIGCTISVTKAMGQLAITYLFALLVAKQSVQAFVPRFKGSGPAIVTQPSARFLGPKAMPVTRSRREGLDLVMSLSEASAKSTKVKSGRACVRGSGLVGEVRD